MNFVRPLAVRRWARLPAALILASSTLSFMLAGCGGSDTGTGDTDSGTIGLILPDGGLVRDATGTDARGDGSTHHPDGSRGPDGAHAPGHDGQSPVDSGVDVGPGVDAGLCSAASCDGASCCGTVCVDESSDPNNCGGCDQECDQGAVCHQGSCVFSSCSGTDAPFGGSFNGEPCLEEAGAVGTCCGGSCLSIDLHTDPNNCGGCGIVCATGETCQDFCALPDGGTGGCTETSGCPAGLVCSGTLTTCLSPTCGASNGGEQCALDATGDEGTCCGNACANIDVDANNCGQCGNVCGAGTFCDEGGCAPIPTCATSPGAGCPLASGAIGTCCAGACVSTLTSENDCGGCGLVCPTGSTCDGGQCLTGADGGIGSCTATSGCAAGSTCNFSRCLGETCTAANEGSACGFGPRDHGTCCGGTCVDLLQDPNNCGACGTACASGVCAGSFAGTTCVPVAGVSNCEFPCGGATICAGTMCVPAACEGPFGQCAAQDGNVGQCCEFGFGGAMCMDISTDANNCGGCGYACPSGQTCAAGVCSGTVAPCGAGKVGEYCDLAKGTSYECCSGDGCTDTNVDPNNCGQCGNVCSPGLQCETGNCLAVTCTATTQEEGCVGVPGGENYCCGATCSDWSSDAANCGGCGQGCATGETCVEGSCGVPACSATTGGDPCHLADGEPGQCCSSGCIDTSSDSANCGGCGLPCPTGKSCTSGACH